MHHSSRPAPASRLQGLSLSLIGWGDWTVERPKHTMNWNNGVARPARLLAAAHLRGGSLVAGGVASTTTGVSVFAPASTTGFPTLPGAVASSIRFSPPI